MKTLAAIPCHNEGLTIGSVVLKARKYVDLVLVIDDGSADDTVDVAESAGAVSFCMRRIQDMVQRFDRVLIMQRSMVLMS